MALKTYIGDLKALEKHIRASDKRIKINIYNFNKVQCLKIYESLCSTSIFIGTTAGRHLQGIAGEGSKVVTLYIYDNEVKHSASKSYYHTDNSCHPWILSVGVSVDKYKDIWS